MAEAIFLPIRLPLIIFLVVKTTLTHFHNRSTPCLMVSFSIRDNASPYQDKTKAYFPYLMTPATSDNQGSQYVREMGNRNMSLDTPPSDRKPYILYLAP